MMFPWIVSFFKNETFKDNIPLTIEQNDRSTVESREIDLLQKNRARDRGEEGKGI